MEHDKEAEYLLIKFYVKAICGFSNPAKYEFISSLKSFKHLPSGEIYVEEISTVTDKYLETKKVRDEYKHKLTYLKENVIEIISNHEHSKEIEVLLDNLFMEVE